MAISASTLGIWWLSAGRRGAERIGALPMTWLPSDYRRRRLFPAFHPPLRMAVFRPAGAGFFSSTRSRLAQADMSTAWALGIVAVHNFQIALLDPARAGRSMGARAPTAWCRVRTIRSAPSAHGGRRRGDAARGAGAGRAAACIATGCCWAGSFPGEGYRTFLVPAADYRIDDTWYTMGLQGTGSNDIVIDAPVFRARLPHASSQMDGYPGASIISQRGIMICPGRKCSSASSTPARSARCAMRLRCFANVSGWAQPT